MSTTTLCAENIANATLRELPASSTQSLMDVSFALALVHSIINTIAPIMSILGNGFLIFALTKSQNAREIPSNFLLISLATSDILIGLTAQSLLCIAGISTLLGKCSLTQSRFVGDAIFYCSYIFIYSSCFNVVVLTIDRYVCIAFPLRYLRLVSKRRVLYVIAATWLSSTVVTSLRIIPIFSKAAMQASTSIVFLSVISVTTFCHFKIMKIARRHKRQIRAQDQLLSIELSKKQELKRARTTLIFVVVLFVCCLPVLLVRCLYAFGSSKLQSAIKIIQPFSSSIMLLNSSMNPFIYFYRSGDLRRRVLQVFSDFRRK